MSPIDSILGIRDLVVQRVERRRDTHVWAKPTIRPACVYCQREALRIKATYLRTLKHTRLRATEAYRSEVFEAHDGGVSQRKLTLTHRIGSATVERWHQSYVKQRVSELSSRSCPQVLGIDERFFSHKRGDATTLVDLKKKP